VPGLQSKKALWLALLGASRGLWFLVPVHLLFWVCFQGFSLSSVFWLLFACWVRPVFHFLLLSVLCQAFWLLCCRAVLVALVFCFWYRVCPRSLYPLGCICSLPQKGFVHCRTTCSEVPYVCMRRETNDSKTSIHQKTYGRIFAWVVLPPSQINYILTKSKLNIFRLDHQFL
jgi:hypothetical protein